MSAGKLLNIRERGYFLVSDLIMLVGRPEAEIRMEMRILDIRTMIRFGAEVIAEGDARSLMLNFARTQLAAAGPSLPGYSLSHLRALMRRAIAATGLDLSGKTVLTEAASGAYATTPVIAAMAGATRVFAFARPSPYGSVAEVESWISQLASFAEVADRITIVEAITPEILGAVDIAPIVVIFGP
jgi:hypothetical protein